MRSRLSSLCCFRILPKEILIHYVSALKIKGIGKRITNPMRFHFPPIVLLWQLHILSASLLSNCICCLSWGSFPWAPRTAFVKHFSTGGQNYILLYVVEELHFGPGPILSNTVHSLYISRGWEQVKILILCWKEHCPNFKESSSLCKPVHFYVVKHNIHSSSFFKAYNDFLN